MVAVVATSGEDSSNSMRRASWYQMTLEDEKESERKYMFRVVQHRSPSHDPEHVAKRPLGSEVDSVVREQSLEIDPGGDDTRSISLASGEYYHFVSWMYSCVIFLGVGV